MGNKNRKLNDWHLKQWERIEDEFGEPAKDLVFDMYINLRIAQDIIASVLGVSRDTIRLWRQWWSIKTMRCPNPEYLPSVLNERAIGLGYRDFKTAIIEMRVDGFTWRQISETIPCSLKAISNHIPESVKGINNHTTEGREAKRQNVYRLHQRIRNGEVELGGFAKVTLENVSPYYHRDI